MFLLFRIPVCVHADAYRGAVMPRGWFCGLTIMSFVVVLEFLSKNRKQIIFRRTTLRFEKLSKIIVIKGNIIKLFPLDQNELSAGVG